MSKPPAANPRDALRSLAPKLIELTDDVLLVTFGKGPACRSATAAS